MRSKKCVLSLALVVVLCLSLLPLGALASEEGSAEPTEEAAEMTAEEPEAEPEEALNLAEEPVESEEAPEVEEVPTQDGADAATSGTCGDNLTWTLEDGVLTISGTGDMDDYDFGSWFPWYSERSTITTVVIEKGVTSIGRLAFESCTSLASVTIPDSVASIGGLVFEYCTSLTSVTIPDSVTSIGEAAFEYCTSLTSVTIPDSVTSIGSYAFAETPWAESQGDFLIVNGILLAYQGSDAQVVIPDSVCSIGDSAFWYCSSLESVVIPNGVTREPLIKFALP